MVWKPKERELTREEAIDEAKKVLAPFWYNSGPLFMASPTSEGMRVFPIEDSFASGRWLVALIDPFTPMGVMALRHLKVLHSRHVPHDLSTVVIFRSGHEFARDRSTLESMLEREGIRFPCCLDSDGALHAGFSAQNLAESHFRLYDRSLCRISFSSAGLRPELELQIQGILREKDTGLALRPILQGADIKLISESMHELGGDSQGTEKVNFTGSGWIIEPRRRLAQSAECALEFEVTSGEVYFLVGPVGRSISTIKIPVSINGAPAYPEHRGENLQEDDDGRTVLVLKQARLLAALNLPLPTSTRTHRVRLEFPQATAENPIAIYSFFVVGKA